MAVNAKTTTRKMVNLPRDVASWADEWRTKAMPGASESEALRRLVEVGLKATESPDHLMERCKAATDAGATVGQVFAKVLEGHPLVSNVTINERVLTAYLMDGKQLIFSGKDKSWEIIPS